jgi:hypothetical protein
MISLLSKLSSYYRHNDKMEEAPNKRNALANLMDDVFVEILRYFPVRSLFCCKCVYRFWKCLISDNHKLMPQTMAGFIYDGIYGQRNFTSITGLYPSVEILTYGYIKSRVQWFSIDEDP